MAVTNVEGDDRVSIVWFEGEPDKSTLNAMIVDESFNIINGASVSIMARGGSTQRSLSEVTYCFSHTTMSPPSDAW